jgi:hypothetical protein
VSLLGTSAQKEGEVIVVGAADKKKKETTRTTKENEVTSRNLRKKGTVIHR